MAFEADGTGLPGAGGDDHATAAGFGAGFDGLVDGRLVLGGCRGGRRAILGDVKTLVGEGHLTDALLNGFVVGVPTLCHHGQGEQHA